MTFFYFGGKTGAPGNRAIVKWMSSEGIDCRALEGRDWDNFDWDKLNQDEVDLIEKPLDGFLKSHTKKELFNGAIEKSIILYPLANAKDIAENPQLKARNYWTKVNHLELNTDITYPGAFLKATETSSA